MRDFLTVLIWLNYFIFMLQSKESPQEQLIESRKRLELALTGADLGVWDWNIQTGDVIFDERWAAMLGYRLDEIDPHVKSWEKLVHPDDMPFVMEVLTAHLDGKSPAYRCEHRLKHKDGHYIWVLDSGKVFERTGDGKPIRAVGIHLDITAGKQAEADKDKLINQLKKSNEALNQYAQVIAHDLQQPLAALILLLDKALLEATEGREDALLTDLQTCQAAAVEMSSTTEYLLEYASATRGEIAAVPVDLKALAEHVAGLLPYMYPENEIERITISPDLPTVRCDKIQIERVFMNLMGNALKHAGSRLLILNVTAREADGFVTISIEDNGPGIDRTDLDDIFLFTRTDDSRNIQGHGIGLAICKKLIEDHGGKIWAESTSGKGSVFHFTLPI